MLHRVTETVFKRNQDGICVSVTKMENSRYQVDEKYLVYASLVLNVTPGNFIWEKCQHLYQFPS